MTIKTQIIKIMNFYQIFDLSINFILEGNINFNNKKNLLYKSLRKSKFYKNYEQLNNLNNNEELSTIFKNFNFYEELLIFNIVFNYVNNFQDYSELIK